MGLENVTPAKLREGVWLAFDGTAQQLSQDSSAASDLSDSFATTLSC
tara:strand:- start:2172 stop:2312 length:141 start_codon:yes stop_codon:yes gene_type:complete